MIHPRDTYKVEGLGPTGRICFMMIACGIGDDLCALPAIAQLAKTHEVTIYCRPFHMALWRTLNVRVIGVKQAFDTYVADTGECIDMLWEAKNKPLYGTIYHMNNWAGWEDDTIGASKRARIQQFAELIGVSMLPIGNTFFRDTLRPSHVSQIPYTLLATESVETWRTIPLVKAQELFDELSLVSFVRWVGTRGVSQRRTMESANSWSELLNLVWNAERVVAVDSGIAHIAAALGKPLTVIGGMTDVAGIFEQYRTYVPGFSLKVVQSHYDGCSSPCYRLADKGFIRGVCCGSFYEPQCLVAVEADAIVSLVLSA